MDQQTYPDAVISGFEIEVRDEDGVLEVKKAVIGLEATNCGKTLDAIDLKNGHKYIYLHLQFTNSDQDVFSYMTEAEIITNGRINDIGDWSIDVQEILNLAASSRQDGIRIVDVRIQARGRDNGQQFWIVGGKWESGQSLYLVLDSANGKILDKIE
jgi:hypothetical protein